MSVGTVSVIIPAYNQGHYLGEAVQSVLNQSYQDFELIIIDDGSTDNTRQVAKSFSDARIRYTYQENSGLSAARNTGIRHATGSFVTFLDSDDLFLAEKLNLLVAALENKPSDLASATSIGFVAGQAILIDANSRRLDKMVGTKLPDDNLQLLLGNPLHVGSVLVRRSWLDKVGPFDESLRACEDWDMWLRLAKAGCRMGWVARPVSLYRIHGQQMTRQAKRMRKAMLTVLDKTFNYPDLPESWLAMRDRAYAAAYVKAAARAYYTTALASAKRDLAEAVRLDPSLLDHEARKLTNQLAGWANAPMVDDPLAYLERMYENLPDTLSRLRQRRRHHLGQIAMQMVFESYNKGDLAKTRSVILRALRYQPSWLINRGVLSIFVRSYFHSLAKKA